MLKHFIGAQLSDEEMECYENRREKRREEMSVRLQGRGDWRHGDMLDIKVGNHWSVGYLIDL